MNTYERINRTRLQYEKRHTINIERALRAQIEPVLDALKDSTDKVISNIDTLITKDHLEVAFERLYGDTGAYFARSTYTHVNGKAQKEELDDVWLAEMLTFTQSFAGDRISSITQTSRDRAVRILRKIMQDEVIPEGLSIFETQNIIRQRFIDEYIGVKKPYTITGRARVIAQTEVLTASEYGSRMGANDAGATHKQWLTSGIILPGQEPRHVGYPGLNKQKRAMDDMFDVRGYPGMYPGDPALPAGESVNCHCAVIYLAENRFPG